MEISKRIFSLLFEFKYLLETTDNTQPSKLELELLRAVADCIHDIGYSLKDMQESGEDCSAEVISACTYIDKFVFENLRKLEKGEKILIQTSKVFPTESKDKNIKE